MSSPILMHANQNFNCTLICKFAHSFPLPSIRSSSSPTTAHLCESNFHTLIFELFSIFFMVGFTPRAFFFFFFHQFWEAHALQALTVKQSRTNLVLLRPSFCNSFPKASASLYTIFRFGIMIKFASSTI